MRKYLLAFLCLWAPLTSRAVIVAGGDGTQNTTSTGAGGGWNYVGGLDSNGATGVYLGAYGGGNWVLTAAHVGAGNFTLSGTTYNAVPGSAVQLQNPDHTLTDLVVFRISTAPSAITANLALRTSATPPSNVTMIGYGRDRDATTTTWFIDTGTSPFVWSTTATPETDATASGYNWKTTRTKRWGTNEVEGTEEISYIVNGSTVFVNSISTDFDNTTNQAQAANGDSGGGMFDLNNNGTPANPTDDFWELSGLMVTVAGFSGQPADTAVFGNLTYGVDISQYRDAILAAVPEPGCVGLLAAGAGALLIARRRVFRKT